jgi:hypothetical protein
MMLIALVALMVAMMAATALPAMATSDRSSIVFYNSKEFGGPSARVLHRGPQNSGTETGGNAGNC